MAVLNEILGLHNKLKAAVHSVHKLAGPKEEKEEEEDTIIIIININININTLLRIKKTKKLWTLMKKYIVFYSLQLYVT